MRNSSMDKRQLDLSNAADMRAARAECHSRLIHIPGIFATSVGFRHAAGASEIVVSVHTMKKRPLRDIPRAAHIPASIDGLPIDVVEGRPPKLAGSKVRPVKGGVEIKGYGVSYGTLGCMVKDKNREYMLSNEHVLGGVGTATYQPATISVCDQIGWVTKAESIRGGKMDCAISNLAKYDDGGLPTIEGIGAITGKCQLFGDVSKSGAHTGVTNGRVNDIDYTLEYDGTKITGQIRVVSNNTGQAFGEQGDSGAAVVIKANGTCQVGGLLWGVASSAASTVNIFGLITPIETVLTKMEVELVVQAQLLRSARIARETPIDRIAALLDQSRRGQLYWQSFVRNQDSLQQLFAESPRLAASLRGIPLDPLMDTVLQASLNPESTIPRQIGNVDTGHVVSSFAGALAPFLTDTELRDSMDELSKLIIHNIGKTWNEALNGAKTSAAGAP